jgi:hypothetical protein
MRQRFLHVMKRNNWTDEAAKTRGNRSWLRPGFLGKWRFAKNPMTAGRLGKKFKNAVNEASDLARPFASNLKEAVVVPKVTNSL